MLFRSVVSAGDIGRGSSATEDSFGEFAGSEGRVADSLRLHAAIKIKDIIVITKNSFFTNSASG